MSSKKHMLQAAAGNAGGDRPNAVINGEGLVYDVTDPENIVALNSVTLGSNSASDFLAYHNNYLYASESGTSYLAVYDATDPDNITNINATVPQLTNSSSFGKAIDPNEDVLYCGRQGSYGGIISLDISDPTNITTLDTLALSGVSSAISYGVGLDAANNRVAVINNYGQVYIVDCTYPHNLTQVHSAGLSGSSRSIQCLSSQSRAYTGTSYDYFYRLSYSSDITLGYSYITHAEIDDPQQIAIDQTNEIAYQVNRTGDNIVAFDISGTTPSVIGYLVGSPTNYLNAIRGLAINDEGTVAYASAGQYFCTIDISDPYNMSFIDTVAQTGGGYGLTKLW